jgi:hypothetical protein
VSLKHNKNTNNERSIQNKNNDFSKRAGVKTMLFKN